MNTNKLKAYAPKARIAFMDAVKSRAAKLGIFEDRISEITIDGDSAIIEKEVYTRKQGQQRNQLVQRIKALGTHDGKFVHKDGFNQFINETAFTWFNRLTAIRYMEVNEYLDHGYRVLSNGENAKFGEGFEILNSAADVANELGLNKDQIIDMVLDGNKEEELYRTLLLGQCHQLSEAMPFMFEKLDDATELLLPDNLTKTDSILKSLIDDLPEFEVEWTNIEIIGWLYQFYISEHKDAVMGKVVKREDIPAATQLFTPNWIVKYLVQNSLGRQWLATYPDSELKDKMEYYITPAEQSDDVIEQLKAITPTSIDPEDIKVLDPACGSGHILVEVYEVLREIYLERGYRLREIPELILTKNIYGLDIDDRAAQMAAFAVLMKAREDDKRIFTRDIKLNIHSIQSTENLNINQLWADLDFDGNKQTGSMGDLFSEPQLELAEPSAENKVFLDLLRYLKEQFIDAKNLGSLIEIDSQYLESLTTLQETLAEKELGNDPTTREAAQALLPIVEQAIVLANKYDVSVANPPYMGAKSGMNLALKEFAKKYFPKSKSDLFAIFMERSFSFLKREGLNAQVNMQAWMFLTSFEKIREHILQSKTIVSMAHLGSRAFSQISGEVVQTTAWIAKNDYVKDYQSVYQRLIDGNEKDKRKNFFLGEYKYSHLKPRDFALIPGSPIAYWVSSSLISTFASRKLADLADAKQGMATCDNDRFLRYWHEVDFQNISFDCNSNKESELRSEKWYAYNKGGTFRRWYGNNEHIVNWKNNGKELRAFVEELNKLRPGGRLKNPEYYFRKCATWSDISSTSVCSRYVPPGYIFDTTGPSIFDDVNLDVRFYVGLLNSKIANDFVQLMNPSLHFTLRDANSFPIPESIEHSNISIIQSCIDISKSDWDSFEISKDFTLNSLLSCKESTIYEAYKRFKEKWESLTRKLYELETLNDQYFDSLYKQPNSKKNHIESFDSISLKNNYHFACYGQNNKEDIYASNCIYELISYSLGCIMGRYSLDREGLVYAHSGNNGFKELVAENAYKSFPADDDGIVPLADEDWVFEDDATTRFREFVKTVWGEEHLQENLDFVAESLCLDAIKAKKGESSIDTIRRYFSTQFYKDHLKTYKKRPIYWLFSSGKAKAFECLVYLHRYNEGTLSRMRTEYVTPLMGKLESRKNILEDSKATASGAELRAIDKELKTIEKKQAELVTFDEELKHLAEMKISLDLDDGVKVNYGKFGNLLADVKAIHGKVPEVIK
ncbi:BREX-1 system adenine-specific DNA-methyltransferase PglX [Vibrio parahaemolyticus]|nr:BREX-1 system adenine-specific DNA-methyltransferase PglX [Vibrio parahaemolyticus]WMN92992.1 BREX-1 system adenine-specific DNA-methyltransferase PglX [Vibrio parahaemolyticus]WMO10611.1 BREX-1 system adenine-specific DNA-methyltransferase PglX [Vibrio parahaemolyticus]